MEKNKMQSSLEHKVQYADTDAYGVVWHGTYLRWMEAGRVDLLEKMGVFLEDLKKEYGIVMPVVELDIKYKFSARVMDKIIVNTTIKEITNASVSFEQEVVLKDNSKVCTKSILKGVALNKEGKIIRNLPELLDLKCTV